ncbi:fibrinogen C domain-containing protein 1 [Bactrocera oleae]|uniref:fibrinogen C domain-containing protein 1 n=1 Tax=Bactrocera oleae TaxID=104688 RepID=UPI00387E705C
MFRFVVIILAQCILLFQIRFCFGQDNRTGKVCDCKCNCVVQMGVGKQYVKDWIDVRNNTNKISIIERVLLPNRVSKPSSCMKAAANSLKSGIYKIQLEKFNISDLEVFCEEDIDFGGWIVIQRRVSDSVDFYRTWNDYKEGFGDLTGNYWIGLEKLHALTSSCEQELHVQLTRRNGKKYYAKYSQFLIGDESQKYALKKVGNYSGTAIDSLTYHLGRKFSTHDRDNDNSARNCAKVHKGAWWFERCYTSHLNGVYGRRKYGVNWNSITIEESLIFSQMMIRPAKIFWRRLLLSNSIRCA